MKKETRFLIAGVLLTYIFGVYGYSLCLSSSFLDCLYATTILFFMNLSVDVDQINPYLEVARWLAFITSSSVILSVLKSLLTSYKYHWDLRDSKVVVLHGDSAESLQKHFQHAVIYRHPVLWKAARHVFAFEKDQDALDYLSQNQQYIKAETQITLLTSSLSRNDYTKQNLQICSLSEICARHYWKTFPVENPHEKIIIAGNGDYCETLLDYAVMLNVIHPHSTIEYHVFLKDSDYLKHHHELKSCFSIQKISNESDSLVFYQDSLKDHRDLIESADRIILMNDQDELNLKLMNDLIRYYTVKQIHMKGSSSSMIQDLYGKQVQSISVNEIMNEEMILNDESMKLSKQIHADYYKNYVCLSKCSKNCLQCSAFLKDWSSLSPFVRYSNVAQADHIAIKKRILMKMMKDSSTDPEKFYLSLSEEKLLFLDEIEHIRWARYHYLNNWKTGETKDKTLKTHPLLVPFSALSYEEILKDRDTWKNAVRFMEK